MQRSIWQSELFLIWMIVPRVIENSNPEKMMWWVLFIDKIGIFMVEIKG